MKKLFLIGIVALLLTSAVQAFEGPAVQTYEGLLPSPFSPVDKGWLGREPGGNLQQHIERWKALTASGKDVEIRGFCASACTLVTAYVPKERLCFGQTAVLGFHLARLPNGQPAMIASWAMFNSYPQDIRMWLETKGGVENMPLDSLWLLFPSELWKMGYRRCEWLGTMPGQHPADLEPLKK